jgi:hypothetical protein
VLFVAHQQSAPYGAHLYAEPGRDAEGAAVWPRLHGLRDVWQGTRSRDF